MHIVYAVSTCSENVYKKLFANVKDKPAFQSQKYHRLLIEGLAKHVKVDVAANPPVNRNVMNKAFVCLSKEEAGGAVYHYLPAIRNPILKMAVVGIGTFFQTLSLSKKDSVVMVDVLQRVTAFSALLASRLRRIPCVAIITDLPDMLGGGGFFVKMGNFVIRHATGYVLLTQAMNTYIQNENKPYVVLEGHADITMADRIPSLERKKKNRTVLYAGSVCAQYGLKNLVDGFRMADIPNARLEIYGPGDYVQELQRIAAEDDRIFYGGMLLSSEVVDKEMEATLLVNPRPTDEEFVKYSFPSKTMEYMASGTPVATTVLPGMPEEYHPYVYLFRDESAEGIAKTLQEVFENDDQTLFNKGQEARKFVLDTRNNVIQAAKIVETFSK